MNNDNNQSILIVITFVYVTVLYVVTKYRSPRSGMRATVREHPHFTPENLAAYFQLLAIASLVSILLGALATKQIALTFAYCGLNLFVSAAIGVKLFLYRYGTDSRTTHRSTKGIKNKNDSWLV